jgi:tetratricopeptide (TPR) repeat protein
VGERDRPTSRVSHFLIGIASILLSMPSGNSAIAQTRSMISDLDMCNGNLGASPEIKIIGCTAFIKSGVDSAQLVAIAHNNRGNAYAARQQYTLAIRDYEDAIKLYPNYAKPFNNRGVAYEKMDEYDRAIADFDAAIKLDPTYADALINRGETYLKKADYSRALKDFDEQLS